MKDFSQSGLAVRPARVSLKAAAAWETAEPAPAAARVPAQPLMQPLAQVQVPAPVRSHPALRRRVRPAPAVRSGWYARGGKRALDIALVLVTAPVTVPLIALLALALWIEGGLPFYRQERLGRNGRRFRIWKLRTMVRDADALLEHYLALDPALQMEWKRTQKLKNDPRVTTVGNFLRVTSLDELPQLWNVLRGDMSLVGPRPMMPGQLALYGDSRAYFSVRPGITGLWQISARNESAFSRRAALDTAYCASMSLRGDLGILWRTVGVVLRRTGY